MAIAKGANKLLIMKRQTAKGTLAVAGSGGQVIRRDTSTFDRSKESYTTESEQTSRKQLMSSRHGAVTVNGSLSALFSPGTYADFFAALLMREFTAIANITGVTATVAAAGTNTFTLTRTTGSWFTDGAKIGRVIRPTAGLAIGSRRNLLIVAITSATAMTVMPLNRKALAIETAVPACTFTFPGGVTYVPETAHTDIYYTAEEWFPEVPRSQINQDVKAASVNVRLPGSGNAGLDWTFLGLDQTKAAVRYFSAPTNETTTGVMVAAGGALIVNGLRRGTVTDLSFNLDARGAVADPVVGDVIRPDVFTGKLMASGSFTAYYDSADIPDLYDDEVETSIVSALAASNADTADFNTFSMHKIKLNSSTPDDVETGLKRTYNFVALFNDLGGPTLATTASTIELQDSAVVPS
jgi:hypothetical protein